MNNLEKILKEKGIKKKFYADKLGVTPNYLTTKIKNLDTYTVQQVKLTKDILNLSDDEILEIFFK